MEVLFEKLSDGASSSRSSPTKSPSKKLEELIESHQGSERPEKEDSFSDIARK